MNWFLATTRSTHRLKRCLRANGGLHLLAASSHTKSALCGLRPFSKPFKPVQLSFPKRGCHIDHAPDRMSFVARISSHASFGFIQGSLYHQGATQGPWLPSHPWA